MGLLGGPGQPDERPFISRLVEVVRRPVGIRPCPARKQLADLPVQAPATERRDRLVDSLPNQGVTEANPAPVRLEDEQPMIDRLLEHRVKVALGPGVKWFEEIKGCIGSGNGRSVENDPSRTVERGHPACNDLLNERRDTRRIKVAKTPATRRRSQACHAPLTYAAVR